MEEITEICEKYSKFIFDKNKIKKIDLKYKLASNAVMHFGDVDSDSYPDLLTVVEINNAQKACLFQNSKGSNDER